VIAHPRTSELIERIRRRDGQVGVNLGNAPEEWVKLARELEGELAEARRRLAIYAAEREHNANMGLIVRR